MARILIADGAPKASQDEVARHGCPSNREMFERAFAAQDGAVACHTINIADGEALPAGASLGQFDGVVLTGSPLNLYRPEPAVTRQIEFLRGVFAARLPVWGSCWGLQLAVTALGGTVRLNPRGREIGIARRIRRTEEGRAHALFAGKAAEFDALCSHQDEVETLPQGARVLAFNDVSDVQAVEIVRDGAEFLGVQYHPEHSFAVTAALVSARRVRLAEEGFARSPDEFEPYIADLCALEQDPERRDLAWRYGLDRHVLDPALRSAEIGSWLRLKVLPRRAQRAAAA